MKALRGELVKEMNKMKEKCVEKTKTKFEWDNFLWEFNYYALETLCSFGKIGCEIAKIIKEEHATKNVTRECECKLEP
jgi:hypothetical protein